MENKKYTFIPYSKPVYQNDEMITRSREFFEWADQRRSVRDFSDEPVPEEVIRNIIQTASTAPSGAHKQPWTFCLISSAELKKAIREGAEEEEYKSYNGRMSEEWIEDLEPLGTDWRKEFITTAPWIIVVMKRAYETDANGHKRQNYYVNESVGLAAGFLLMAIHHAGLVTLTHTPSPMNFLSKILNRPENERPFLLIPVGKAAIDAQVPDLQRKTYNNICVEYN